MNANWIAYSVTEQQEEEARRLSESTGLGLVVSRLLVRRGVNTPELAEDYLHPRLGNQPDPYLMLGMDKAVACLRYHLKSRRPIMITGDHDVDGVTSVALIHNVLRDLFDCGERLHYHIPNEDDEGYGISRNCIDWAKALGCELIISVDTGIKALESVDYARREGLDVIICDHHQPDADLPRATAILNPKQTGCHYPNAQLSACGVGYKLMQALAQSEGLPAAKLYNYLDLLAVSTAADLVPLIGENRAYLVHGLHQLSSHPCMGMRALLNQVRIHPGDKIDTSTIIYKIAPRLNAAGRMQNGQLAVDLLTASSLEVAERACKRLEDYNDQRRTHDSRMTAEAEELVAAMGDISEEPILVLYRPDWHVGVMGIVAARMAERYRRPTIVMTKVGHEILASARSFKPYNIYDAIDSCRDLLKNFGGHKYAAGLTTEEAHIPELRHRLKSYMRSIKAPQIARDEVVVDALLSIEEINPRLVEEIRQMAPFGLKNERPVFVTERMRDAGGSKVVGREGQHLRLRMTDRYCRYKPIAGMALHQSGQARWVLSQQAFGIRYTFDEQKLEQGGVHLSIQEIYTH